MEHKQEITCLYLDDMKINFKKLKKIALLLIAILSYNCKAQVQEKQEYYPDGSLKMTYEINDEGKKDGKEIIYHKNGNKSEERNWVDGNLRDSLYIYNQKGNLIQKGIVLEDGTLKLYESKVLVFESNTIEGKLNGQAKFYKNTNLVMSKMYEEDKESGYNVIFHDSIIIPKYIYHSKEGKRTGLLLEFHENGAIKSFRESKIHSDGQYFKFNENGTIKLIGYKVKGQLQGWVYKFNNNGKLEKKILYEKGNIIKEFDNSK